MKSIDKFFAQNLLLWGLLGRATWQSADTCIWCLAGSKFKVYLDLSITNKYMLYMIVKGNHFTIKKVFYLIYNKKKLTLDLWKKKRFWFYQGGVTPPCPGFIRTVCGSQFHTLIWFNDCCHFENVVFHLFWYPIKPCLRAHALMVKRYATLYA